MLIAQPFNHEHLNDVYSRCLQFRLCILEFPGSNLSLEMEYLEMPHSFSLLSTFRKCQESILLDYMMTTFFLILSKLFFTNYPIIV